MTKGFPCETIDTRLFQELCQPSTDSAGDNAAGAAFGANKEAVVPNGASAQNPVQFVSLRLSTVEIRL